MSVDTSFPPVISGTAVSDHEYSIRSDRSSIFGDRIMIEDKAPDVAQIETTSSTMADIEERRATTNPMPQDLRMACFAVCALLSLLVIIIVVVVFAREIRGIF